MCVFKLIAFCTLDCFFMWVTLNIMSESNWFRTMWSPQPKKKPHESEKKNVSYLLVSRLFMCVSLRLLCGSISRLWHLQLHSPFSRLLSHKQTNIFFRSDSDVCLCLVALIICRTNAQIFGQRLWLWWCGRARARLNCNCIGWFKLVTTGTRTICSYHYSFLIASSYSFSVTSFCSVL